MTDASYRLTITPPAQRQLRKLPKQVRRHLFNAVQILPKQPDQGAQLHGQLRPFRCLHTVFRRTHYRILYEVSERLQEVVISGVGVRENFYRRLQKQKPKSILN